MTQLTRAGWLLGAAVAGAIALSVLLVPSAGIDPAVLLALVALVAFMRPEWALPLVAALAPVAWYGASQFWNAQVAWPEALVCAALAGLCLDASRPSAARTPAAIAVPAVLLGALTLASLLVSVYVLALRLGPAFAMTMIAQLTREYFVDLRTLPELHAGFLLIEGALLFAHAARVGAAAGVVRRTCGAAAAGAAVSALCTGYRLVDAASRSAHFWSSLLDLSSRLRLSETIHDANAAGSFYALTLPLAAGLAWTSRRGARAAWTACAVAIAAGLWLTSSRMAMLAVPAAAAGVLLVMQAGSRRFLLRGAAIGAAALALVAVLVFVLPQRGLQKSSAVAADVRMGLIQTGLRMIRSHPVFGLGLGQFYERSGQFSSPELLAAFPVAVHENAHNNFVQIAAELGLTAGAVFTWAILIALVRTTRTAARRDDRVAQFLLAGVVGFVLTCLGGHPLLIPEAAYAFWLLAGLGAANPIATAVTPGTARAPWRPAVAAALLLLAFTLPWRMRAAGNAADFDHVAIGVSPQWETSSDGIRYRAATGWATLFIPADGCKLSVNPRTDATVQLELRLGDRVANVVSLSPGRWNDLVVPGRAQRPDARFVRLQLRVLDAPQTVIWLTKDSPL